MYCNALQCSYGELQCQSRSFIYKTGCPLTLCDWWPTSFYSQRTVLLQCIRESFVLCQTRISGNIIRPLKDNLLTTGHYYASLNYQMKTIMKSWLRHLTIYWEISYTKKMRTIFQSPLQRLHRIVEFYMLHMRVDTLHSEILGAQHLYAA